MKLLLKGLKSIIMVYCLLLLGCSGEEPVEPASKPIIKPTELLSHKTNTSKPPLIETTDNISLDSIGMQTKLNDQQVHLLELQRQEMETELQTLIQEMDDNLDNPVVRKEIQEKMRVSTVEYKKTMLLLAKGQLKK